MMKIGKCKSCLSLPNILTSLEIYSQGVNDFVSNMKFYPIEFYLLWTDFEPWTPADSLGMHVLLQYFISFDWFFELTR